MLVKASFYNLSTSDTSLITFGWEVKERKRPCWASKQISHCLLWFQVLFLSLTKYQDARSYKNGENSYHSYEKRAEIGKHKSYLEAWNENIYNMASYSCVYYAKHGLKCNTQVHEKKWKPEYEPLVLSLWILKTSDLIWMVLITYDVNSPSGFLVFFFRA